MENEDFSQLMKGDIRKVAIATALKTSTNVSNPWITERIKMGHERSLNLLIRAGKDNVKVKRMSRNLLKMLQYAVCPELRSTT